MNQISLRHARTLVFFVTLVIVGWSPVAQSQEWSKKKWVDTGTEVCVIYQAAVFEDTLVVQFQHQKPWHSFALDNDVRAKKALGKKKSLGVEEPTKIDVTGLKTSGTWLQSKPTNFSKPDLRWFSWGFEGKGYFATKLPGKNVGSFPDAVKVNIHGQVCNGETCLPIFISIDLTEKNQFKKSFDLKGLQAPITAEVAAKKKEQDWNSVSAEFSKKTVDKIWPQFQYYANDRGLSLAKMLPDLKSIGFGSVDDENRFSKYVAQAGAKLLTEMDPNRDGTISKEEMIASLKKQLYSRMDHRILQDVDGDGRVSAKEYSVSLRVGDRKVDKDGLTTRARSFFERQDANKDGYISIASEVFPDASLEIESQMSRFVVLLKLSRKIQISQPGKDLNEAKLFKLFRPMSAEDQKAVWFGLQDLSRFNRRRSRTQKKKSYVKELKVKSMAYRISTVSKSVLNLIEENL